MSYPFAVLNAKPDEGGRIRRQRVWNRFLRAGGGAQQQMKSLFNRSRTSTMLDPKNRRERGLEIYKKMGWGENEGVRELDEDLWQLTTDFLFGEIWARPGLSLRDRELITLTTLMSVQTEGIRTHMRKAHHLGITYDEIKELILHATYYLGTPKGIFAMRKLKEVMSDEAGAANASPAGEQS